MVNCGVTIVTDTDIKYPYTVHRTGMYPIRILCTNYSRATLSCLCTFLILHILSLRSNLVRVVWHCEPIIVPSFCLVPSSFGTSLNRATLSRSYPCSSSPHSRVRVFPALVNFLCILIFFTTRQLSRPAHLLLFTSVHPSLSGLFTVFCNSIGGQRCQQLQQLTLTRLP